MTGRQRLHMVSLGLQEYILGNGDYISFVLPVVGTGKSVEIPHLAQSVPVGLILNIANVVPAIMLTRSIDIRMVSGELFTASYRHHFAWGPFVAVVPPGRRLYVSGALAATLDLLVMVASLPQEYVRGD